MLKKKEKESDGRTPGEIIGGGGAEGGRDGRRAG